MKITNIKGEPIHLGFLGNHGRTLAIAESVVVEDKYKSHPSIKTMELAGVITTASFSADDQIDAEKSAFDRDPYSYVSSGEFNSYSSGLFKVLDTWTSTTTPTATATPEIVTGSAIGPFDTSQKYILTTLFDGLYEVSVSLPRGQLDIAGVIAALNGDATFATYGVAGQSAGKLTITSLGLGINSSVSFVDSQLSAVTALKLATVVSTAATGVVATVVITTVNPTGQGVSGISHAIKLYTTDVGVSTLSTEFQIQRVSVGTVISGLYTAEAVIATGASGVITFEVAAMGTITEPGDWVAVVVPDTHFLAVIPTARLQVI